MQVQCKRDPAQDPPPLKWLFDTVHQFKCLQKNVLLMLIPGASVTKQKMGHMCCCWERWHPDQQYLWKENRFSSVCDQMQPTSLGQRL